MPFRRIRRGLASARLLAAPLLALTAVAAAAGPQPAAALDYTRFEPLWLAPSMAPPGTAAPQPPPFERQAPVLLNLPPGWMVGDAAAVVVADHPGGDGTRDRLVAALLAERAAVLELNMHTAARGLSTDNRAASPAAPSAAQLLPDLFGALLALRGDAGAGVVVAIGQGLSGDAALLAAGEAAAAAHLGAAGPRFAALVALGPAGRPAFAAGTAPPEAEA
jgi:hypothetical protein